jgi:hypothetical protein|tara:strand:- start:102 stop:311 length:210 start_codon:yes stop_codon:yes gene_type:complete
MTTWTIVSTDSTSWSVIQNTSEGYFETEDNLDLLVTETGLLFQQEGGVVIAPDDWQDTPATATTTWTQQ